MKRGFPRPRTFVNTTHSNPYAGTNGRYRKRWENRYYPHPYTAEDADIATIHQGRLDRSVAEKLCGVCGLKVEEDLVGLILYNTKSRVGRNWPSWIHAEAGPYHFPCLVLAFKNCPHLADTKKFMPGCGIWEDVKPLIRT